MAESFRAIRGGGPNGDGSRVPGGRVVPDGLTVCDLPWRIEAELAYLRVIARRWQREKAAAEDLVQETLLRALANAHLFAPGSNLRAWLFTIMRNLFYAEANAARKTAALREAIAAAFEEKAPHAGEGRLLLRDLERALRRLPKKERALILAVGLDGKSYQEAAEGLGASVPAVRCHLARARDRLRASMNGREECVRYALRPRVNPRPESEEDSFAFLAAE